MPAAAVIPAPIAYIKVAAVKKLVVGSGLFERAVRLHGVTVCSAPQPGYVLHALHWVCLATGTFTLKKLECSKQAYGLA